MVDLDQYEGGDYPTSHGVLLAFLNLNKLPADFTVADIPNDSLYGLTTIDSFLLSYLRSRVPEGRMRFFLQMRGLIDLRIKHVNEVDPVDEARIRDLIPQLQKLRKLYSGDGLTGRQLDRMIRGFESYLEDPNFEIVAGSIPFIGRMSYKLRQECQAVLEGITRYHRNLKDKEIYKKIVYGQELARQLSTVPVRDLFEHYLAPYLKGVEL